MSKTGTRKSPWVALCAWVALSGCNPAATPEEAVSAFFTEVQTGQWEAAYERLSAPDKAWLVEQFQLRHGLPDPSASDLMRSARLRLTESPQSIRLASRPGPTVQVRVTSAQGQSTTLEIQNEEGRWKVALRSALKRRAPEG